MNYPARLIPDTTVCKKISIILAKCRAEPETPRAAIADNQPTVFFIHERLWNQMQQQLNQLDVLKKLLQDQGVTLDFPSPMELPINWETVKNQLGEAIDKSVELPGILRDQSVRVPGEI